MALRSAVHRIIYLYGTEKYRVSLQTASGADYVFSPHANCHSSACGINSLLFGRAQTEQTLSHIAINIKDSFI